MPLVARKDRTSAVGAHSATPALAAFITGAAVADAVLARATQAVLDTLAVTIAGGVEPGVRTLARAMEASGEPCAVPSLWDRAAYRPDDAALLIGTASHVLDYDDVSMIAVCHPSAPVLSALLAAMPRSGVHGRHLLESFAVGTEVMIRLGEAMGFRHIALGFHATSTLGTIGAAAACARLWRLDERQTAHALAIAASLSCGLRKNFGSAVKSLHVGFAAANGLKAPRLAAMNISGAEEVLEGEGFLHAFSGGEIDRWPDELALGAPFALVDPGFEQKRYPCCYMLHKLIDGTLALRRASGLDLAAIRNIQVDMPAGGTKPLIHPFPKSGMEALFSIPYAATAALADGRIDLASFTDSAVLRPEIQARLGDVSVTEAAGETRHGKDLGDAPVTVTLTPFQGSAISCTVDMAPGSAQDRLTILQQKAKWTDCLRRAHGAIDAAEAVDLFEQGCSMAVLERADDWLSAVRHAVAPC